MREGHRKRVGELRLIVIEKSIEELDTSGHSTEGEQRTDAEEDHEDVNKIALVWEVLILSFLRDRREYRSVN